MKSSVPDDFRNQYAGLLLGSKRYCWIYGHGATWWQYSESDSLKYGKNKNSSLPVDENLAAYKEVLKSKWTSTDWMQSAAYKIKTKSAREFIRYFGFVEKFMISGPFGCKNCDNFQQEFPPEKQILQEVTLKKVEGESGWQVCSVDLQTGYLNYLNHFKPTEWVCAYAFCEIISPASFAAQLRVGTNDMGALWFNGTNILSQNIERSAVLDDDILPVQLQKGKNRILLKVCNTERNWGLYLRITDKDGNALQDLKFLPE
jgi:hypothetical protein